MTPVTAREREVVYTVARHGSIAAAADALGTSVQTIKNQLYVVHRKLGVHSTLQALWLLHVGDFEEELQVVETCPKCGADWLTCGCSVDEALSA